MKTTCIIIMALVFLPGCGISRGDSATEDVPPEVPSDFCAECPLPDEGEFGNVDDLPYESVEAVPDNLRDCSCSAPGVVNSLPGPGTECYQVTGRPCVDHSDCDDGIFCNDEMRCGRFQDGTGYCYYQCCPPCGMDSCSLSPGSDPECHPAVCVEEQRTCLYPLKDSDRDGYADDACDEGDDCDDDNASRHPGMPDICNGEDDNCNVVMDEDGWTVPGGWAVENPISGAGAGASLQALASLDDRWQAAWLENGSMIRFAAIEPASPIEAVDVSGPVWADAAIGDISILGAGGVYYVVWSETGAGGSQILIKAPQGAGSPEVIYSTLSSTGRTIENVRVRSSATVGSAAGVFFKTGVSAGSEDFEIFYIAVPDITASPPALLGPDPIRVTDFLGFSGYPDAAAVPDGWILVWDDARDGTREVYLTRLDFAGTIELDPPVKITGFPGDSQEPSIACIVDLNQCAVAWIDKRYGPFIILSTMVDMSGTIISPEITVTAPPSSAWNHGVTADPARGQFFVTYSASSQPNQNHIYYNFLKMGLDTLLAPKLIEEADSNSTDPRGALTPDGALGVLWKEIRRDTGSASIYLKLLSCLE